MKNAISKDIFRDIKKSFGRFVSILAIVALGVAFFTGVKVSPIDMKNTADKYYDDNNLMDIRLISTLGLTEGDVEEVKKIDGVEGIAPSYFMNVLGEFNSSELVLAAHSIPFSNMNEDNKDYINRLTLVDGRMPNKPGECLVEASKMIEAQIPVGTKLKLSTGTSEKIEDALAYTEYEVVGTVETPYYLSFEKGNAPIGSGKVESFIMIPEEDFKSPAFTEIFLTVSGAKEINSYKDSYFDVVDKVTAQLENISGDRNEIRYEEIKKEVSGKLAEGKLELEKNEKLALEELEKAKDTIDNAKIELAIGENKLKLEESNSNNFIKDSEQKLNEGKKQLEAGEKEYADGLSQFNAIKPAAEEELNKYEGYVSQGESALKYLNDEKKKLEAEYQTNPTEALKNKIDGLNIVITSSEEALNVVKAELNAKRQELVDAENKLKESRKLLDTSKIELESKTKTLEAGKLAAKNGFDKAREELVKGRVELEKGEEAYSTNKLEVEKQLKIAREKIEDGEKSLAEIEKPEWIILDRNSHYSYMDYKNSADSIDALAAVFPVFFFLVAALVCLTTMTRMVDEQRVNIGTLKALGYSKGAIASKYIVYALAASLTGSIVGLAIGLTVFPLVVFNAYGIMYSLPPVELGFNIPLALGATLAAVLVTTLAAMSACYKELVETPSVLMRPKAPKEGKRILLERIPFIWNKFNFIGKVTVRNILRYKKRFFMTVFGIAGCTALLLTGFGIKDSIQTIVDKQFGVIYKYDTAINLDASIVNTQKEDINSYLENDSRVDKYAYMSTQNGKVTKDDTTKDISIVVPQDLNSLEDFIVLENRTTGEKVELNQDGIILTEKVAKQLGVEVGDEITIRDKDDKQGKATITGIVENYLSHYVYMTKEYYKKVFGKDAVYNGIYTMNNINVDEESALSSDIIELDGVVGVGFTSSIKNSFGDTIKSLNYVVLILIISAGALAFVVLYNLTNVNISERMREIATIKVLGFYDNEVSAYIYRENIILTVIGTLGGLGLGILLHRFIMITVELESLMFGRNINVPSFILSAFLTLFFALLVNVAMYYKLRNVKMVESLKSVD